MTWTQDAQSFVAALAATGRAFSADEVWSMCAHHSKHVQEHPRAMGAIMRVMGRWGVIEALPTWLSSVRAPDRALRLFRGTGTEHPEHKVTEKRVLWALQAIEAVAQARSQMMVDELRKTRKVARA